jgi:hypothetical protein
MRSIAMSRAGTGVGESTPNRLPCHGQSTCPATPNRNRKHGEIHDRNTMDDVLMVNRVRGTLASSSRAKLIHELRAGAILPTDRNM